MSENTKIEWATHTFNPWVGCTKISPACDHCYAEGWAKRSGQVVWDGDRKRTSIANWKLPLKWNQQAEIRQHGWQICVDTHPDSEAIAIAAGFIKPVRPKVFCASLADVFDNAVDPVWRDNLFTLIANTQNLDWLLLTKRIGNASTMLPWLPGYTGPDGQRTTNVWRNVWLGATICNQAEADRDIPKLLAVPAAKRFLSMEPLLGQVDLERWLEPSGLDTDLGLSNPGIDWAIVGGESGHNARPMHPDWARSLRDQCESAEVPFLFKQWGEWVNAYPQPAGTPGRFCLAPRDKDAWVSNVELDAYPRQFTAFGSDILERIGKKAAGRLLDGREWNGVPV